MLTVKTAKLLKELIPNMERVLHLANTTHIPSANKLLIMYKMVQRENFPEDGTLYLSLKVRDFIKEQTGYYEFH